MIRINLNEYVRIKPNSRGLAILKQEGVAMKDIDKDGYYRLSFWEMMNIFGSHMVMGIAPPFDIDDVVIEGHKSLLKSTT